MVGLINDGLWSNLFVTMLIPFFPTSSLGFHMVGHRFRVFNWLSAEMGGLNVIHYRLGWKEGLHFFLTRFCQSVATSSTTKVSPIPLILYISKIQMSAYKIVLIRHGESCWNQDNRFCGWFDADLSETGAQEAKRGGQALKGLFTIRILDIWDC